MKHVHAKSGLVFEVGRLYDFNGSTFDMCIITKWNEHCDSAPTIVGYYFGDYNKDVTDEYIDMYIDNQKQLNKAVAIIVNSIKDTSNNKEAKELGLIMESVNDYIWY